MDVLDRLFPVVYEEPYAVRVYIKSPTGYTGNSYDLVELSFEEWNYWMGREDILVDDITNWSEESRAFDRTTPTLLEGRESA